MSATTAASLTDSSNSHESNLHSAFGSSFSKQKKPHRYSKAELLSRFQSYHNSALSQSLPEGFKVWDTITSNALLPPVNTTELYKWDVNTRINPDSTGSSKAKSLSSSSSGRGRGRGRGGGSLGRLNTYHGTRTEVLPSPTTPPNQPLWAQDESLESKDDALLDDTFSDTKGEGFSLESLAANTMRAADSWRSSIKPYSDQPISEASPAIEETTWRKKTPLKEPEESLKIPENIDFESLWMYSTPDKPGYQGPFTLDKLRTWAVSGYFSADIVRVQPYSDDISPAKGYLILKSVIDSAEENEKKRAVEDVILEDDDHVQGVVNVITDDYSKSRFTHVPVTHHPHPRMHQQQHQPQHTQHVQHQQHPQHPQQPRHPQMAQQQFGAWQQQMMPQYEMLMRMQQSPQFVPPHLLPQQGWGVPPQAFNPRIADAVVSAEAIENELKQALKMQAQATQNTTPQQQAESTVVEQSEQSPPQQQQEQKQEYYDEDLILPPSASSSLIVSVDQSAKEQKKKKEKQVVKQATKVVEPAPKKKKGNTSSNNNKKKKNTEPEKLNPLPHQPSDEQFYQLIKEKEDLEILEQIYEEQNESEPEQEPVKPKSKPKTSITVVSTPAAWSQVDTKLNVSTADVLKEEAKKRKKEQKEQKKKSFQKQVEEELAKEAWPKAISVPAQSILDIQNQQAARKHQEKEQPAAKKVISSTSNQTPSLWGIGALTGVTTVPDTKKTTSTKKKKQADKSTTQENKSKTAEQSESHDEDIFWNYEEEQNKAFSTKDFPAPKEAKAMKAEDAKKNAGADKKKKNTKKTADSFSYASILSTTNSRPFVAAVQPTSTTNTGTVAGLDLEAAFPSLQPSKKSTPISQPTVVSQSAPSYDADFPIPIKKAKKGKKK